MILRISIAGVSLGLDVNSSRIDLHLSGSGIGEEYEQFVATEPDNIHISLKLSGTLQNKKFNRHFDSSALWVLHYNDRNDFRIEFKKGFRDASLAFIDVDLNNRAGTVFYTEEGLRDPATGFLPFVHPVDGVIFINLLPSCNGILLHACGVADDGRGFIFPGRSGDGKSTTARLWEGEVGAKVLSDERIIIREIEKQFYAFGTPWHGELKVCDPGKVQVEKILFLEHAEKNHLKHISAIDAAARMLVRCLPPFWDKEGMDLTLSLIDRIVRNIPCYELGFMPDKSAVRFVRNLDLAGVKLR